jgi:hypothetical protein
MPPHGLLLIVQAVLRDVALAPEPVDERCRSDASDEIVATYTCHAAMAGAWFAKSFDNQPGVITHLPTFTCKEPVHVVCQT